MHDDTQPSRAAPSNDHASRRKARFIIAAVIALAIGSVAFVVQPGLGRADRIDYAAASVANLAPSAPAGVTGTGTESASASGSAAAPRFQRSDEPAYTDAMNPHGG
ncbi:MAG TPA: hypothetical protein PLR35_11970 [Burkholderiaceae bacterium]|nr:hypothetical protein [Burkholderiaceae bacterium]